MALSAAYISMENPDRILGKKTQIKKDRGAPMSRIEWCDTTLNPITGKCPHGCEYCYAEAMRKRFHWSEEMQFKPEVLEKMLKLRSPRTIFWGSAFDLFADTVSSSQIELVLDICTHLNSERIQPHNHVFLTKNPKRYAEFAHYKKVGNIFFGTSSTGSLLTTLDENYGHYIDFVSVEPFIDTDKNWMSLAQEFKAATFSHIIIGGLTGRGNDPYKTTDYEAVVRLCKAAFECDKKVFIKNNLIKYAPLPVGMPYNIGADVENFRQLPWKLYTKNVMDGAK